MLFQTGIYLSLLLTLGAWLHNIPAAARASELRLTVRQQAVSQVRRRTKVTSQTLFDDFNY